MRRVWSASGLTVTFVFAQLSRERERVVGTSRGRVVASCGGALVNIGSATPGPVVVRVFSATQPVRSIARAGAATSAAARAGRGGVIGRSVDRFRGVRIYRSERWEWWWGWREGDGVLRAANVNLGVRDSDAMGNPV